MDGQATCLDQEAALLALIPCPEKHVQQLQAIGNSNTWANSGLAPTTLEALELDTMTQTASGEIHTPCAVSTRLHHKWGAAAHRMGAGLHLTLTGS